MQNYDINADIPSAQLVQTFFAHKNEILISTQITNLRAAS